MFTSNFSDRFKKAPVGFQKAHDELSVLKADIAAEKQAADEHVAKLAKAASQVDSTLQQPGGFYCINYIEANMKQWLKDFTHNCIVHPLMMFIPKKWANELHDRNANWAFGLDRYDELKLENKK